MINSTQSMPKPGTPFSVRKAEVDDLRFLDIRNLVVNVYKKQDGSPFMSYPESLRDRELVKAALLEYELMNGLITKDGDMAALPPSNGAALNVSIPVQPVAVPPQAQQPEQVAVPVPPVMNVPTIQIPTIQVPVVAPPPVAEPPKATGKVRKAGPSNGSNVAPPPPPSPTPAIAQPVTVAPPSPMPMPMPVVTAAPVPTPVLPPQAQPPQPPATVNVQDLTNKIDQLGRGLGIVSENTDRVEKMGLEIISNQRVILTALHHIYSRFVDPNVPKFTPEFVDHIKKFNP